MKLTMPTIYQYQGRWWHGGIYRGMDGADTNAELLREVVWLLRHGEICTGWNWPKLIFGFGRDWYDGPIWHLNLGIWQASLSVK